MSKLLYVVLIVAIIMLVKLLRRKPVYVGNVVQKDMSRQNDGNSYVVIKTATGEDKMFAFDTYAKINCRHYGIFGSSQCFHGKGVELDESIKVGGSIKLETEGSDDVVPYVRRHLPFLGKG